MFSPLNKSVIVKLDTSPYENIATEKAQYDAQNIGLVVDHGDYPELEDKKVIWVAFREKDAMFNSDNEAYASIPYEDLRGVQE